MDRREYITAIGGMGTGAATLPATATDRGGVSLSRTSPDDYVTYVRPDDRLVFEAAASPGVDARAPEWTVDPYDHDGEGDVSPGAPFWTYTGQTGNPAAVGQFADPGWYRVVVAAGEASVGWWVYASSDAPAAPSVDLECDPGADATVTADETIELTATANDEQGTLDRVLWQEGRNATYLGDDDVTGNRATATREAPATRSWIAGGYPAAAWALCRDGRVGVATADPPDVRALRTVTITGTNAPVDAGDDLVVEAEVGVDGNSMYHGFVDVTADLIVGHDPTHVDSATRELYTGQTATVELSFATAVVTNTQTFPVRVETATGADETDVTVIGTDDEHGEGHLAVTALETNAPVAGGERLEATATLSNQGDAAAEREVELVVGRDPQVVDTATVDVAAGGSTTVSLGYETYPVETDDEFPVYVRTGDDTASKTVLVHGIDGGGGDGDDGHGGGDGGGDGDTGTATFAVSITGTNAPVAGGERLSVSATIENEGDGAGSHAVELVVGHDPQMVDTATIQLEPGESTSRSLGYETYPVQTDDTFPVTVRTPHASDTVTVTVRGTDG